VERKINGTCAYHALGISWLIPLSLPTIALISGLALNQKRKPPMRRHAFPDIAKQLLAGNTPANIAKKKGIYRFAQSTHCFMLSYTVDVFIRIPDKS
jgi:hypothetical protein